MNKAKENLLIINEANEQEVALWSQTAKFLQIFFLKILSKEAKIVFLK